MKVSELLESVESNDFYIKLKELKIDVNDDYDSMERMMQLYSKPSASHSFKRIAYPKIKSFESDLKLLANCPIRDKTDPRLMKCIATAKLNLRKFLKLKSELGIIL